VVPQAIGISLRNRIGDSAGEFLVVDLWGLVSWHSMYLNCSLSLVSVLGMGACMLGRAWLVWNKSQPVCLPVVYASFSSCTRVYCLQSRIHAVFPVISAYTRGFTAHSRVYPGFYPFVEDSGLLGEFWLLLSLLWHCLCLLLPLFLTRNVLFSLNFFFRKVLVMASLIFCLRLVH